MIKNKISYSPILIFCYRRKIDKLIYSLKQNRESKFSELFIFSDGYKTQSEKIDVLNVRSSLKKISGFKKIKIFFHDKNIGLANSIIYGTTKIINKYQKIIVLEDDLIVSKYFLDYMNNSLELFKDKLNIWSISGYNPPLNLNSKNELFLVPRASSWGWATWKNRWDKIDWSMKKFHKLNKKQIEKFEIGGNDLYKMLELQNKGIINSWAIRWCFNQFLNSSYSVTPKSSMVINNGFSDNLGTNTFGAGKKYQVKLADSKIDNYNLILNKIIINKYKKFHDVTIFSIINYKLSNFRIYNFLKFKIRNLIKI